MTISKMTNVYNALARLFACIFIARNTKQTLIKNEATKNAQTAAQNIHTSWKGEQILQNVFPSKENIMKQAEELAAGDM